MLIFDVSFFITSLLILFVYTNYSKYIALYLSIFTIFFSNFLIYTYNYGPLFMIKAVLISFTSLCIFASIIYNCLEKPATYILTWLLRLNILAMIFAISNIYLQILLLITAITTPFILVKNSELKLSPTFIPVTAWIILYTATLLWYHNDNIYFKNNSFNIFGIALFIPVLMHFYNNTYLQTRAISLCLVLIFHVFSNDKSIFNLTW